MKPPKIEIPKTGWDKTLELLTLLLITATFGCVAIYYNALPDRIPIYFNWPSKIDGLGAKNILWTCPIFSAVIALGIHRLCHFPWILNYPTEITSENARINYKLATGMLRMLSLVISLSFLCLSLMSIYAGLGRPLGIENNFLILFSVLMVCIPVVYISLVKVKTSKKDKLL